MCYSAVAYTHPLNLNRHVLDPIQFYSYPPGFNFEDDPKSRVFPSNVEARAAQFADFIVSKAAGYATNSLLVPFGSDFQYTVSGDPSSSSFG
jgi:hypothetical protein